MDGEVCDGDGRSSSSQGAGAFESAREVGREEEVLVEVEVVEGVGSHEGRRNEGRSGG